MREAEVARLILAVQDGGTLGSHLLVVMDRLSAASDASAGTSHDLYEIVVDLALLDGGKEFVGIAQAVGDSHVQLGAVDIEGCFLPAVLASYCTECIRVGIGACYEVIGCTEGCLHNAARCTEDITCTGADTQRHIKGHIGDLTGLDLLGPDKTVDLSCGKYDIDIGIAACIVHGGDGTLVLLRQTGHYRYAEDLGRIYAQDIRIVALGYGTEHLLGRLGGGEVIHELGIVGLDEPYPAGAAGCEHRELRLILICKPGEELGTFLHNREVGSEVRVEDIVESHDLQSSAESLDRCLLGRQSEGLAPGSPDGGSDLDDRDLLGIAEGIDDLLRIIPLGERSDGAVGDALAAECAVGSLERICTAYVDSGTGTRIDEIPDAACLAVAHLDAAHALDASAVVPLKREILIAVLLGYVILVRDIVDIQVVGELLKRAVAGSDASGAVAEVLGKDELDIGLPCLTYLS